MSDPRELLKETQTKLVVITIAIVGGLFWVSNLFVTGPLQEKMAALKMRKDVEAQRRDLLFAISGFEKKLSKKTALLAEKTDRAGLIEFLSGLGREAGVSLSSVTPQEPEKRDRFARLPVVVETSCGWRELGRFCSRLESAEKFMKIERVSILQNREAREAGTTMNVTLLISVFLPAG